MPGKDERSSIIAVLKIIVDCCRGILFHGIFEQFVIFLIRKRQGIGCIELAAEWGVYAAAIGESRGLLFKCSLSKASHARIPDIRNNLPASFFRRIYRGIKIYRVHGPVICFREGKPVVTLTLICLIVPLFTAGSVFDNLRDLAACFPAGAAAQHHQKTEYNYKGLFHGVYTPQSRLITESILRPHLLCSRQV